MCLGCTPNKTITSLSQTIILMVKPGSTQHFPIFMGKKSGIYHPFSRVFPWFNRHFSITESCLLLALEMLAEATHGDIQRAIRLLPDLSRGWKNWGRSGEIWSPRCWEKRFIELDDGKIYRKTLYLMVKTMVSCRFSLKPIQWKNMKCHEMSNGCQDVLASHAWWSLCRTSARLGWSSWPNRFGLF